MRILVEVMNKIKRFLETSGIYFMGSILSKLIAVFLLPLYTSNLSPEVFGTYDLVVTIVSFFAPIAFFQIWDGMFRFSFDKHKNNDKYIVISNSFSVMGIGFIVFSIIFGVVYNIFRFEIPWLIYSYGISIAILYQYQFIARAFFRNKLFVVSGLINSLLNAGINIFLILKLNVGIESLYIASISGALIQVLIIELRIRPLRNFRFKDLNKQMQLEMVKFSVPLCVSSVSYWMLSGYTKVGISQQLGNHANGLYAVATKFTSMITIVITVFQYAWHELAYLISAEGNRNAKYEKSIEYIFKIVLVGSGIFILLIKIVFPLFVNPTYNDALLIVPLSLVGVAANAFADFVGTIFLAEKKTRLIFWTTIFSVGINIICLWIFTPIWGVQGAVGALSLSFVTIALLRIYAVGKLFSIKLSLSNFNYIFLLATVFYVYFTVDSILMLFIIVLILICIAAYSLRDILIILLKSIKNK